MVPEIPAGTTDNLGSSAAAVTPAATPSATEAPKTAVEALQKAETTLAAADSSSANPDLTSNGTKSASAAAEQQPDPTKVTPGGDAKGDPMWDAIPEPRRNVILENARKKGADEALASHWSANYEEAQVQAGIGFATSINRNPVGFAVQLVGELMENPRAAALLSQHLGQHFGGGANRGEPDRTVPKELPKGRLVGEDGKTRAYAEDQMPEVVAFIKNQLMEELGGEINPIKERFAALDEREEAVQVIHESRQEARSLLTEMRGLSHWPKPDPTTNKNPGEVKIHSYLAQIPAEVKAKIGYEAAVRRAFQTYLDKDVYPTLSQRSEEAARDDMKRKAAATAGHVAPGGGAAAVPAKKPSNVRELSAHLEQLAAANGGL